MVEDGSHLDALAQRLMQTPPDDRGPLVERANNFFGIDVVDAHGDPLKPRHGELVRVHGRGRETQALYEFGLSFYHAIRGWRYVNEAQRDRRRTEGDLRRRQKLLNRIQTTQRQRTDKRTH